MNHLIVLCGPVGSGKSTLAKAFLKQKPDFLFVDIFNFIKKYKDDNGHIEPAQSLEAHRDLYRHLQFINQNVLLEIGTNRPELNSNSIAALGVRFDINVLFCLLNAEICIKRVMDRAAESNQRKISKRNLEEKFKRVFPDNHVKIARSLKLSHDSLDMSLGIDELVQIVMQRVSRSKSN